MLTGAMHAFRCLARCNRPRAAFDAQFTEGNEDFAKGIVDLGFEILPC